jgi:hypothetical protein
VIAALTKGQLSKQGWCVSSVVLIQLTVLFGPTTGGLPRRDIGANHDEARGVFRVLFGNDFY